MAKRRRFSAKFKRQAVELTRRPQASVSQVAQKLGVNANVLSCWRRELTKPSKAFTGAGVSRDEELASLRRELARVKKERFFARCGGVLRQGIVVKYAMIRHHRDQYTSADLPVPEGLAQVT